ncbi:Protein of unknown function (DUF3102) [Desulfitobacterium sp. LBE]|uniref:DUF3102 domain-containing protein n=1 Tax=Desulfitobacterium hafniense (strain Y51) TaxID=138119 RepID=Q24VL0_DESHY|nr:MULTISPECIES: DUF3102 domain-containing protein [Desulfitobacterium]TWH60876.1 Protein of unknown function (DUF3102) [Desulfitobacterium sp. LBE]BAE83932.1 hypothetical protein DSY2143 [Desulfitobacterium hafniense Y51]
MDLELSSRTPQIIAAEINSIKEQTGKILLHSAIEIGRRLTEAKAMVNHGEWQKWLESSVSYSQSTANKLMRVFAEYGSKLAADHQAGANSEAMTSLSYTQAVILLGVPEAERESFIVENEVSAMSTRELQQAVKERDEALGKNAELQETVDSNTGTITQLTAERDELRKQASGLKAAGRTNEATIRTLQEQLETAKKGDASAGKIAALEKELQAARAKVSANKIIFHFDSLTKSFNELLKELTKLAPADPETHQKYKGEIGEFIGKMGKMLSS